MNKALSCALIAAVFILAMSSLVVAEEPKRINKTLGGIDGSVEIVVDTNGVPHIYAEREADAMFALGYMHARDRLWQMDFNRRAAQGKLSEILGSDALEHDAFVRTIGLNRLARESVEKVKDSPRVYMNMIAYAWGVNSYVAENMQEGLPLEFQSMGYLPGPWTPEDSLSLSKAMAWELSGSMDDLYLGTLAERLGTETVDELFPIDRYREIPIIPPKREKIQLPDTIDGTASAVEPRRYSLRRAGPAEAYCAALRKASYRFRILGSDRMVGSNNWVIDGSKSARGKPMLASDPHLGLTMPSVWYAAHIRAKDLDVIGVTLPGIPGVIIGHNRNVAWGITNTQADVTDFFIERLNDERTEYLHEGNWKPLETITETVSVRGGEPREVRVLATGHGPILSSLGADIAIQWAGAVIGDDALTYYLLNHAVDYDDFATAMKTMGTPAQNFAYADAHGMIAMWVAGSFPVRRSGLGRVPADGASGEFDWLGFIPRIDTPHCINPSRHFLASANQRPAAEPYEHYLGYEWDPGYRARRINHLLASHKAITADQMKIFQADAYDTLAEAMLPHLLKSCEGAFKEDRLYGKALAVLSEWDFVASAESPAPTIWWQWLNELRRNVWEDEWQAAGIEPLADAWGHTDLNQWHPPLEVLEELVVEEPNAKWFDDVATDERETLADIAPRSLRLAIDALSGRLGQHFSQWNWGSTNRLRIDHLSGEPALGRGGHPLSGSDLTLSARGDGSDVTGGPSWRMVVDFSDIDNLAGIYPGGQSGDPASPHYDDLIDDWARDEYIALPFYRSPRQFPPERTEMLIKLSAPLAHLESSIP